MYILVADSCGCGLGILGEIARYNNMPYAIFLADGQMNPFGLRSTLEIQNIVEDWLKYFTNPPYVIKMLVVACNTASISIMGGFQQYLETRYNVRIVNIIESTVRAVPEAVIDDKCNIANIAVLGTKRTIESGIYQCLISESLSKAKYHNIRVQGIICTGVERAVARGEGNSEEVAQIANANYKIIRGNLIMLFMPVLAFLLLRRR